MSESQYDGFAAIDRPLTEADMAPLRKVSTGQISASGLVMFAVLAFKKPPIRRRSRMRRRPRLESCRWTQQRLAACPELWKNPGDRNSPRRRLACAYNGRCWCSRPGSQAAVQREAGGKAQPGLL